MAGPIELPWQPKKSRQQEGMASEKRAAKRHGARLHPRSGAGKIKDDASNEETIFEFKDVMKSHSLSGAALDALFTRATQQGKEARYVVHFVEAGLEATITLRRMPR